MLVLGSALLACIAVLSSCALIGNLIGECWPPRYCFAIQLDDAFSADQTERDWLLATILEAEQFDCYYVWRSNHDGTWGTCYHFKTDNHLSYRFRGEAVEIELTGSESCANERNYARLRGQLDTLVESLDAAGLRVSAPNHPDFSGGYRF